MKSIVSGILAHVDAGKTTLSEAMMYLSGNIRNLGRVDHKDSFLDTFFIERQRGITIFSKQARLFYKDMVINLLDTPGHVDFSTEMERTLRILDYGILVISSSEGIQSHTETLWKLLREYEIPVFIFVNKMDLGRRDKKEILLELSDTLKENFVDFSSERISDEVFYEEVASSDEKTLEQFIETGKVSCESIAEAVLKRQLFPVCFGSALKLDGILDFLNIIHDFTKKKKYGSEFGAKVYKISRDSQGNRLTHIKVTGGTLYAKNTVKIRKTSEDAPISQPVEEKVDQLRFYSGEKFTVENRCQAGDICAVTGLENTFPGVGMGCEPFENSRHLEPVLKYKVVPADDTDISKVYKALNILCEEDPSLTVTWNEDLKEINVKLMGQIQLQVIKEIIKDRFGFDIKFDEGDIVYKETICSTVEGVGHFEPLRHYAEVHLLMKPGKPGSGISVKLDCSEDVLDINWQRLISNHILEKKHKGILTGCELTDVEITVTGGRAHIKHTEGGDFRQATYRAVRQGLMEAENQLLEPFYRFELKIPTENTGRAISDINRMYGQCSDPVTYGDITYIEGTAPVATIKDYINQVNAYTRGRGSLSFMYDGYKKCHNEDEVIKKYGYDCLADTENTPDSVFCSNGTGFTVPWYEVKKYMHVNTEAARKLKALNGISDEGKNNKADNNMKSQGKTYKGTIEEDKELLEIFEKTYGTVKKPQERFGFTEKRQSVPEKDKEYKNNKIKSYEDEYLLVDGYNIIFSWDELAELAKVNLDSARLKLLDILCNYQGFKKCNVIVVFDGYKVKGGTEEVMKYHNINVVYTKEAETADMYIAKVTKDMTKKHRVKVATSDALEQLIIMGNGAIRLSQRDLKADIDMAQYQMRQIISDIH